MKPEQRVAARVVEKYSLTVPIDVEGLAREHAELEEDDLPVNSDAVVISTPKGGKPLIIISRRIAQTRRRFTLAHEIGHILIPWHMGTFACHTTNAAVCLGDHLYITTEAESNRFASALLLPPQWLSNVASSGMSPGQMVKFVVSAAAVSAEAVCLALCRVLSEGHLFVLIDKNGFVAMAAASPNSSIRVPVKGEHLHIEEYSKRCALHEALAASGDRCIHWWKYAVNTQISFHSEHRSSKEILKAIVEAAAFGQTQAKSMAQSVAGIIGAAYGGRRPERAEELFGLLRQSFTARSDLLPITSHPDFETFLSMKSVEIIARRPIPLRAAFDNERNNRDDNASDTASKAQS
jgi:hypothetical protein